MPSTPRPSFLWQVPDNLNFTVAVVDADPTHAAKLVRWVQRSGHRCHAFPSRAGLSQALRRDTFDLLILNCDDPGGGFAALTQHLRQRAAFAIPILAMGAGASELDILDAVDRGADAYLPKSLNAPEVVARTRALLQHCYPMAHRAVRDIGEYRFDMPSRSAFIDGEPVDLRGHEFDFAACLFSNLGRTFSHQYLTRVALGDDGQLDNQTFRTIISRLRRKLRLQGAGAYQLRAVHTLGYRLAHTGADAVSPSASTYAGLASAM